MKTIAAIGMIGWVGFLCGYRAAADDSRGAQAAPALPPLTEAEYSQCRSWYQEVGFESLAKMPFVRVATGASYSSNGKDEQNTYLIGFLADEAARDDGKDFAILTLDRNRCRFKRSKPDERESRRVGFERVPFNTWLHEFLAAPADESGKVTNLSSVSPFANAYPTTPAVTACHLAMLCDDLGLHEEAVKIMADIPSRLTVDEGKGKPVAERLQQEFGHVLIWQAVIDCDNPANPRSELLKRFERIIKHCPKSRHVEMAQGFATLLKRMIAEDAAHAAARAAKPFDVIIKTVSYGAPSSNGTYGQGGNAWEWNDAVTAGRGLRGGSWNSNQGGGVGSYVFDLASTGRGGEDPSSESIYIGFRVASVPIAVWLASKGFSPNTSPLTPVAKLGGTSLLMAYALNLDPNQSYSSNPLPKAVVVGTQMSYTFYAGNTDVGYRVETSTDLAKWSTSGVTVSAPDVNGNSTAAVPLTGSTRFIRLVVSH